MQKPSLFVGLTGGIGSGKSTIANVFACLGIPVLQADTLAKFLLNNNQTLQENIKNLLGEQAYTGNIYNKKYVAETVFKNPKLLEALNNLVHPMVHAQSQKWFTQQSNCPYALYEAALITKESKRIFLNKIIVVEAPLAQRLDAVSKRDQRTPEQIHQIINTQQSVEEYRTFADYIIQNNYSQSIINQVIEIHKSIRPPHDIPPKQFIP
jgi:dephospho-CoA kinase